MFHKLVFAVALGWAWFAKRISKWLTDDEVQVIYEREGKYFGDAVSYLYMGECIGFEKMLDSWAFWEGEYARRGYVTLSIDAFTAAGGYNRPLNDLLGERRPDGDDPIYHAARYRERFLGKMPKGVLDGGFGSFVGKDGKPQVIVAQYPVPSTEDRPSEEE